MLRVTRNGWNWLDDGLALQGTSLSFSPRPDKMCHCGAKHNERGKECKNCKDHPEKLS